MDKEILDKVSVINKENFKGFVIDGIFGSYSREDNNALSDIDILYDLTQEFRAKY